MLYYLFDYLNDLDLPGAGVFQYISFRAGMAAFVSLLITITFGKSLINFLRRKQVGEDIRDLGLEGQLQKKGTPTMGGLIIIAAILIVPLSYYFIGGWIENFAYRTNLNYILFAIVALMALLFAFLTVAFHSLKTARTNPVESLKYE